MPLSHQTLSFLAENRIQDSRVWYQEHKADFQKYVLSPMAELAQRLGPVMLELDPQLVTEPKVDRTLSRVYRDTRFSKDKLLYREVMWVVFFRDKKEFPNAPGFVFEFSPDGFRYGCGWYMAPPKVMEAIRSLILKGDRTFLEAKEAFERQDVFQLEGELYRRNRYPDSPEELQQWLNRKNLNLMHNSRDFDLLFSDDLADTLAEHFKLLKPVYQFIIRAVESV